MVLEDRTLNVLINCVNENYFDVCRLKFLSGRPLNKQEIIDGIQVAVIDKFTADQYFGKNEDPIGKNIELGGKQYRITGVVKNNSIVALISGGVTSTNIWVSHHAAPSMQDKYIMTFTAKNKASIPEMRAEFDRILNEINTARDSQYSINEVTQSISEQSNFLEIGGFIVILILMLIPALNILSLNISKSHERSEEIAVRKAFGAPLRTIFGQLFFENTLLTLVGAAIGMCITPFLLRALDRMMFNFSSLFPLSFALHFDWTSVFLIAVPCVLLFSFFSGSIPAWITAKREIVAVLKGDEYENAVIRGRKRSLAWIFMEQMLVFAVMLFCFTGLSSRVMSHFSKGNLNMENIIIVENSTIDRSDDDEQEANAAQFHSMVERMREWQSVDVISINRFNAIPLMGTRNDSVSVNNIYYRASIKYCDEHYYRMFSPKLTEGNWFRDADAMLETPPALVTQLFADNAGLKGSAVGHTIFYKGRHYRIIGVVDAFKERAISEQQAALFIPASLSTDERWQYAIKCKPGMGSDFSKAFLAEFFRNFPRDQFKPAVFDFQKFSEQAGFIESTMMFYMFGIPTAFLLIFAFMGTFGVVWMQSKKRMCEFGVRIAFGCTPARLMRKVIFENLILTTFAMLPGMIVVAGIYGYAPKGWEWTAAVGAAIVLMWLFSAFSAWYPARQAAKVQPVDALRANQ
jgi:ABC-type antimicrobial peptide transport system permease subunit